MAYVDLHEGVLEEFASAAHPPLGRELSAVPPEGFHIVRTQRRQRRYSPSTFRARQEYRRAFVAQAYGKRVRAALLAGHRPKYRTALVVRLAAELGIDLDARPR